jgi:hypothetical protein
LKQTAGIPTSLLFLFLGKEKKQEGMMAGEETLVCFWGYENVEGRRIQIIYGQKENQIKTIVLVCKHSKKKEG